MGDECGGDRRSGRQKRRCMDSVHVDLREKGLSGEETKNHAVCRQLVGNIDPTHNWGKKRLKKKNR